MRNAVIALIVSLSALSAHAGGWTDCRTNSEESEVSKVWLWGGDYYDGLTGEVELTVKTEQGKEVLNTVCMDLMDTQRRCELRASNGLVYNVLLFANAEGRFASVSRKGQPDIQIKCTYGKVKEDLQEEGLM